MYNVSLTNTQLLVNMNTKQHNGQDNHKRKQRRHGAPILHQVKWSQHGILCIPSQSQSRSEVGNNRFFVWQNRQPVFWKALIHKKRTKQKKILQTNQNERAEVMSKFQNNGGSGRSRLFGQYNQCNYTINPQLSVMNGHVIIQYVSKHV